MTGEGNMDKPPHNGGETPKVAFVLSGGGTRGALEAGALLALLDNGIRPHILVGTSVGAINAAGLAFDPTPEGARWVADMWCSVKREELVPDGYMRMVWRLLSGKGGLLPNQHLRRFLESCLPPNIGRFADIEKAELYVTALSLENGELHVFGVDRSESILDAVMASTAVPVLFSPWRYQGHRYVDGGLLDDLPVRVALQMGATELYAIDVAPYQKVKRHLKGVAHRVGRAVNLKKYRGFLDQLEPDGGPAPGLIHHIRITDPEHKFLWDFNRTAERVEMGRQVTLEYLRRHGPGAESSSPEQQ